MDVFGGVSNVAYNLSRALEKKIIITRYPALVSKSRYAISLLKIYSHLAIQDFDIVHFNVSPTWTQGGYSLFKLAKLSRASIILNVHGIIQLEYELYGRKKNMWPWLSSNRDLMRTLRYCKMANKIVTYSKFMRNRITHWYRINPNKIVVIPNGVNVNKFSESKNELSLAGDPSILYLGHLSKGADFLINAISAIRFELPKLKLNMVGGGDITSLKMLAKKKNIERQVVFYGSVAPERTPYYYKAADFFIFPALKTPAGITILEAMASGTPVIASNRGGTTEIICHGKNGILFEPNDPNSLPEAILTLHKNQKLKKTISRNAMKTAKKFSWENVADKYVSLYRSLSE